MLGRAALVLLGLSLASCSSTKSRGDALATAKAVDLNRYTGHVDESYREAIVGTPNRKYLWLLARTSTLPEQRYAALVARAERLGFDVSRLLKDPHPSSGNPPSTPP